MNIGALIRKHRKENMLTLKVVAERAGISEGFLSQVENNVSSPSVDTLVKICNAIDVNAGDLLNQVEKREPLLVIRKSEWDDIDLPHIGFVTRRFVSPENRTVIDSAILFLEAKKTIPVRKNIKNGQEVLCIIKGTLELIHGERTIELGEGDTVHFWSDPKKQRVTNTGKGLAVALWIGTL
jgi:transcriptional regulator with XRE-family HTH domain